MHRAINIDINIPKNSTHIICLYLLRVKAKFKSSNSGCTVFLTLCHFGIFAWSLIHQNLGQKVGAEFRLS